MVSDASVRRAALAGSVLVSAIAALVVVGLLAGPPAPARHHVIASNGLELLPGESLTDWATYGDSLVEATVQSEVELPVSEGDVERAYVPRGLILSVDRILWRRPSAANLKVPDTLHFQLDGWDESDSAARLIRPEGEPVMTDGHRYAVLLTHLVPSEHVTVEQWAPTNLKAIVPLEAGVLNEVDRATTGDARMTFRESVTGKSLAALLTSLRSSPIDPAAAPYMGLPADERYQRARTK